MPICDALRDLVLFVQFKKREKHPWRSVTFSKVEACNFTQGHNPSMVFFMYFKLYKWYQIVQGVSYDPKEPLLEKVLKRRK